MSDNSKIIIVLVLCCLCLIILGVGGYFGYKEITKPINCKLSNWSTGTPACPNSTNKTTKTRTVTKDAENDGKCDDELTKVEDCPTPYVPPTGTGGTPTGTGGTPTGTGGTPTGTGGTPTGTGGTPTGTGGTPVVIPTLDSTNINRYFIGNNDNDFAFVPLADESVKIPKTTASTKYKCAQECIKDNLCGAYLFINSTTEANPCIKYKYLSAKKTFSLKNETGDFQKGIGYKNLFKITNETDKNKYIDSSYMGDYGNINITNAKGQFYSPIVSNITDLECAELLMRDDKAIAYKWESWANALAGGGSMNTCYLIYSDPPLIEKQTTNGWERRTLKLGKKRTNVV